MSINSSRRDLLIDGARGLFHVAMLTDHLPLLFPGVFSWLGVVFEPFGYLSVAEGFMFLSGYVTGLVYTRIRSQSGTGAMWKKALRRSLTIYLFYIISVALLLFLLHSRRIPFGQWGSWAELSEQPLLIGLGKVVLLTYQPAFLEILPMYALFIALAPPLLLWMEDGRTKWILITSVIVWAGAQFGLRDAVLGTVFNFEGINFGYFDLFGWQILFVCGLILGRRASLRIGRSAVSSVPWAVVGSAALFVSTLFLVRHGIIHIDVAESLIERSNLGILRLLSFACFALLTARFKRILEKLVARGALILLSKYSLPVFALHLIPVYFASRLFQMPTQTCSLDHVYFLLFCVGSLFGIAVLADLVEGPWAQTLVNLVYLRSKRGRILVDKFVSPQEVSPSPKTDI